MATGAQVIVDELERAGVEVCFGLPGVHNLALWEALRSSSIRLVGVRHEQAAAYAADGYARATGRLGVALTTTGPGAANTLGAVGEAWASRSPILVIATDIPSSLRREGAYRGVLHETDGQAEMFAPVVKSMHLGLAPEAVAPSAVAAIASAQTAPTRPVYLEIATDLLSAEVPAALAGAHPDPTACARVRGGDRASGRRRASAAVGRRRGARRGTGDHRAGREAGGAGADDLRRGRRPPPGHPCLVGLPPHVEAAGRLWDDADVVLAIGSDLDGVQTQNFTQPQPETLIAVSLEEPVNYRVDVQLTGDAGDIARALTAGLGEHGVLEPLAERLAAARAAACETLDPTALRFLDAIHFAVPGDGVLVVDMCIPGYWLAGFHTPAAPRRLQVPLGWGTLGYAFPAALGAALAGAGPAVSISGDGGFLFACGELATMAQERIPLTAVIVDDGGYGMLRYDQVVSGDETYGVDLHTPDFEAMATSFGVRAETVDGLDDPFGEALARHVAEPGPSVLVARTPVPLVPPPNTSPNWYRKRRAA